MVSFVFSLSEGASALQEAVVRSGLETRFPEIRFECGRDVGDDLGDMIIPISGYPHPTEADRIIMRPVAPALVNEVREVFDDLLQRSRAVLPS